jgi:uncharacterized protein YdbL (DUF1318 family)
MEERAMKSNTILMTIVLAGLLVVSSCSFKAPEVRVTGEMTALEREVLGTYRQMEEDTWMVASTRSKGDAKEVKLSPEKKQVLDAMQDQKFNKDDIEEFKKLGYIGENNTGFLDLRPVPDLESDPEKAKMVSEIVGEENQAREVIMERVIQLNEKLKNAVKDNVTYIFAQMNQENSPVGTWIQQKLGEWVKKQ